MKPFGIVLASLLLITPISLAAAPPATQPSLEKENAALKLRVAELELKVAELQARMALQTPRLSVAPYAPGPFRMDLNQGRYTVAPMQTQPAVPAQPAMPPGWVERQFNGQPYYLVPLAEQAK